MSNPLIMAVPSKGRMEEAARYFFRRAGLDFVKSRGSRDYQGSVTGLRGVEIAFLSAAEIAIQLAKGNVHLGVTGEDLVNEKIGTADVTSLQKLGFGTASIVVAVPQAWIDVETMADLEDVAISFRRKNQRSMRIATKYANLTRGFLGRRKFQDYLIVESLGATEAAPATGAAEFIVDVVSTGATLTANGLKLLDGGLILKSEASLFASLRASWSPAALELAREILDRITASVRAYSNYEVRTRFAGCTSALLSEMERMFQVFAPFHQPTSTGMLTLHCPLDNIHALAKFLRDRGAETVSVAALTYVYSGENRLFEKLTGALGRETNRI